MLREISYSQWRRNGEASDGVKIDILDIDMPIYMNTWFYCNAIHDGSSTEPNIIHFYNDINNTQRYAFKTSFSINGTVTIILLFLGI